MAVISSGYSTLKDQTEIMFCRLLLNERGHIRKLRLKRIYCFQYTVNWWIQITLSNDVICCKGGGLMNTWIPGQKTLCVEVN